MSEVLSLKYRPKSFKEVIGQDQVISSLEKALKKGTLGHALIFCGTRGSGKTSTARLVARALNKEVPDEEWMKISPLLVQELDAASNNGVDSIRDLIESVRYVRQGHSVVILDEAHMLTRSAFNALLKTLEEPPPGVTFILLTTEPHKLLPTVRSRCQLYEFKEVDPDVLAEYFTKIAKKEKLKLSKEDIYNVALKAEGSVRDGLSILQKYLGGGEVEDLSPKYLELVSSIYTQDTITALEVLRDIRTVEEARTVAQTLEKWFYWCSLEAFGVRTPIRPLLSPEATDSFDLQHLQKLFSKCLEIERALTTTPNSNVVLEMGVIGLCLG